MLLLAFWLYAVFLAVVQVQDSRGFAPWVLEPACMICAISSSVDGPRAGALSSGGYTVSSAPVLNVDQEIT